ncbi:MAG: BatD family protein [bacterium]|nr:BatD family protein [bacterium]
MVKTVATIAIWISILTLPLVAADEDLFQFVATVATQTAAVDQSFVLEVTLSGPGLEKASAPSSPDFGDRLIVNSVAQSNSFSWINGKVNSSKSYRYILTPTKVGSLLIPSFQLEIDNTRYQTEPIKMTIVNQAAAPQVAKSPIAPKTHTQTTAQSPTNQESLILVNATANRTSVFEGESIEYRVTLLRRVSIWSNISYEAPDFSGFLTTDKPRQEDYIVSIDAQRYYALEILNKALYPLEPGEKVISPTKVSFIINPFYGQKQLDTEPITIEVKPLPEDGKTDQFAGAVGQFSVSASIQTNTVKQNTPITVKLNIAGQGNLSTISDLNVTAPENMRIYKSTVIDSELGREFDYIVVPGAPGNHTIPAFTLHYFDPESLSYMTASSTATPITILPSGSAPGTNSDALPQSINQPHYLKSLVALKPAPTSPHRNPLFWVVVCLNLIGVSIVTMRKVAHQYRHSNPERWQKKSAFTTAELALQHLLKSKDVNGISSISAIVLRYISDTTNVHVMGLADTQLKVALSNALSDGLVDRIRTYLARITTIAYQPKENTEEQIAQFKTVVNDAQALIKAIGKESG